VLRKPFLVLYLLFVAADISAAQAAVRRDTAGSAQSRSGTWSARTSTGRTFMGTWTAVPDPTTGTVTGAWALTDAQGNPVAGGAWSASKATTQWTGYWRGVVTGRPGEFSGTWTASTDLKADASFADLFEQAVETVVSGDWRVGGLSGAWSIRAARREGGT
jgi:hypothetical protein